VFFYLHKEATMKATEMSKIISGGLPDVDQTAKLVKHLRDNPDQICAVLRLAYEIGGSDAVMLAQFSLDNIGGQFTRRAKNRWMAQIDEGSQDMVRSMGKGGE
jgi:hypothetical protein